jgi:uncharacterized protein (TIGR03435 family)
LYYILKGWRSNMERMPSKQFLCFSLASLCLTLGPALLSVSAAAQGSNTAHVEQTSSDAGKKKEVKFEVVSIRPVKPGWSPYDGSPVPLSNTNPTADGFTARLTIWQMMMIAYAPEGINSWASIPMINAPKWFGDGDWYDINAHVSDDDLAAWRNQDSKHELLSSAMRAVLKERCKLAIHEQPTEIPDYKLVIGKKGPKLQATAPGSALPSGVKLKSGGVMVGETRDGRTTWRFHGATMEDLAWFLTNLTQDRPVHDGTGLTGRYDFMLQSGDPHSRDIDHPLDNWPIDHLGLEAKPGKSPGFTLVVDHMEKPDAD